MWFTKRNFVVNNIYKGMSKEYLKPQYIVEVSAVGLFKVCGDLILTIKEYEGVTNETIKKVKEEVKELLKDMKLV